MSQRIRLKIGENEIELEGDGKFIGKHLKLFLDNYASFKLAEIKEGAPPPSPRDKNKGRKLLSPAEYVRQKNPKGGTEKLVVLAKYLEDYESLSEFKAKDINRVAKQAKSGRIDGAYYPLAVSQGLLNRIKHGTYQLTLTGEDVVVNMGNPAN